MIADKLLSILENFVHYILLKRTVDRRHNFVCTKFIKINWKQLFTSTSTILALFRIIIGGQYLNQYESHVSEEVLPFMVSLSSPTRESLSP